ncbi:ATP-binding cassette domain-containing protein [Magnetospira sp. QH-2]|uniref:ATP-binding cassette domain-containing protein n=1 Tax=Magnetospira sp. (strain QH-2) TaxID=1288970 RepID=UPI0003E81188|nr:ATP-binding cassette domain-containing protein [Magnetospira sp. QH-2]CCQ73212.1 Putative ABC-type multidrug transport system, ATPase and permease components [Magnetospira sp. QH-2]
MKELIRRLASRPGIATELLLASLLANLLALASPLFVIQVLNRYVSYGVDSTLATLTAGVLAAIMLEFGFRHARHRLAEAMLGTANRERAHGAFGLLVSARRDALDQIPVERRRDAVRGLEAVESAFTPANTATLMDIPFALIFVGALFVLSPLLGQIALGFVGGVLLLGIIGLRLQRGPQRGLADTEAAGQALVAAADLTADSIRAFNGHAHVMAGWRRYLEAASNLRRKIGSIQGVSQALTQSAQAVMGAAIIATGATLVVGGELDVGALIGANILAARALGPVARLAQLGESLVRAEQALNRIADLAQLPVEPEKGVQLSPYSGRLGLKDISFGFPGAASPLFEKLDLDLAPGSVLLLRGRNGAGKSTLARLLVGLIEPQRGHIQADGVDLRQLDPVWWRRQISYVPQEPRFLDGTVLDNLKAANPDLDDASVSALIGACGLGRFVNESSDGLHTIIFDNGRRLAAGIRKRLALARALAVDGLVVVLDDPTEGLDAEGRQAVYGLLKGLAERGRTLIIASDDPVIVRGARLILDLDSKPVPKILRVTGRPPSQQGGTAS